MLNYEILKQALKENEEQENDAEELARQKIELQRQKIELQREQLAHKRAELEQKQTEPTTSKKNNFTIVLSLLLSFGVLAFTMIFYIILLLKI